jgi:peptide-methionine (S)-S-oxide reductase
MPKILFAAALAALLSVAPAFAQTKDRAEAIFAGGCFWCVEADFDKVPGVTETVSGYTGGMLADPTYEQVSHGGTGHFEAVRIVYDPAKVSYETLLTVFWHSVDPTDPDGQFCDKGDSYRTAIFVNGAEQRRLAETSKAKAEAALGGKIVTPILDAKPFYAAEGYHQNYYRENPLRYKLYRWNCGRDQRIAELWGEDAFKGLPGH